MIILLLASLSCIICSSNDPFHYKSHDYEFDYSEIINRPNNNILVNDIANKVLITILNSSSLSYIVNNHQLNFFDNTNFDEISYKITIPSTPTKRRMPGISDGRTAKSTTIKAESSGKTVNINCPNAGNIKITQASYGKNCDPSNLNNQLKNLQTACNNKARCKYKIDHRKIGDPARGCRKTYVFKYKCSTRTMYDVPKMHMRAMQHLHSYKHRKALKTHLSQIKESILNEMKRSFQENNKQTLLLQKIDDLKHEQSELDLRQKILEVKKADRAQIKREKKKIRKQELSYERQARKDRQKLMRRKRKFMRQKHAMRMREHKELMGGLKRFILRWKALIKEPPVRRRRNKYDRNGKVHSRKLRKVPMPPLPVGIVHEMGESQRYRRSMLDGDGFGEICKCVYTEFGGKVCIKYNAEKDVVSLQIVGLVNNAFTANKYIENDDVHNVMVYEYQLGLDEIHKCGDDMYETLAFGLCFVGNDDVLLYLEGYNKFGFEWIADNQWDEIIHFDSKQLVTKCVNLAITKICVSYNGDNAFVVESKVPLIDLLFV